MLTRSQVAAILGKSVATVRRMEGVELHPKRNRAGVHLFDPDEVATLRAEQRTAGGIHGSNTYHRRSWLNEPADVDQEASLPDGNAHAPLNVERLDHLLRSARAEGAKEERERIESEQLRQRETERERDDCEHAAAAHALTRVRAELVEFVSGLSGRDFRRLARDPEFIQLLEDLE
jgi:hypothetical protein